MAAPRTKLADQSIDATMYLHPQTLARLGTLELRAKHIVEGVMSGMHRSPHYGFSVEFAQHRPYVPGDDIRHLDWKVFGRTDKLHLKQYEQETNLDLMLLVDASGSMDFGSRLFSDASGSGTKQSADGRPYWSKFDHATALAAAMSYIALKQSDRVGLIVFADQIKAMVRSSSAQAQWRQIVSALSTHPVNAPTNIGRVVDQTLAKISSRRLLVFISDFFEDPNHIRAALARCKHRGQDVILFQVVDKREQEFDLKDAGPFEGLEGEGKVRIDPRALREAYLTAFKKHTESLHRIARSFGFDHMQISTHDRLGPPMAAFLAKRNARLKQSKVG